MDTLPLQLLEYRHEGRGRMAAALTLSLAAHAALLAWRFLPATPATQPSTLEVTLVNSRSEHAPLNPQALAQQNLDGGGDRARGMASSPLPRTAEGSAEESVLAALRRRQAELEAEQRRLLAQLESLDAVQAARPAPELLGRSIDPGEDDRHQDSLILSARIAALKERIERYNALPRQTFTAPSARASDDARYVEAWRQRIELIGTQHYPPEARGRIYGDLQLTVYIRRDGSLERIQFDRPSNQAVLNSAARRIVELASPFDPLPPELAQHTDILAITRTWHFTREGLETDAPGAKEVQ